MKKMLIIGLILFFQNQLIYAQTDSLKYGLKGKIIRALGQSPVSTSVCYAGLKGNYLGTGLVYKSEDAGITWYQLNNGKPVSDYVADIQAIEKANDPEKTLYVGTWKSGLFKSEDDGETWQKDVNFPSADIRSIKTGIQTPLLVYAATSSYGVVKSIDGGKTWKRNSATSINKTFQFAWSIEIDKNNDSIVFAQTFSNGIWKSSDQGETWTKVLDTSGKVCWDMKVSDSSKELWVASSQRGDTLSSVYYSPDHGATWNELPDVPQVGVSQINVIDKSNERVIIIGSWQDGVYVHKDEKWKKEDSVDFETISEILIADDELLIGSWGNGTFNIKL